MCATAYFILPRLVDLVLVPDRGSSADAAVSPWPAPSADGHVSPGFPPSRIAEGQLNRQITQSKCSYQLPVIPTGHLQNPAGPHSHQDRLLRLWNFANRMSCCAFDLHFLLTNEVDFLMFVVLVSLLPRKASSHLFLCSHWLAVLSYGHTGVLHTILEQPLISVRVCWRVALCPLEVPADLSLLRVRDLRS